MWDHFEPTASAAAGFIVLVTWNGRCGLHLGTYAWANKESNVLSLPSRNLIPPDARRCSFHVISIRKNIHKARVYGKFVKYSQWSYCAVVSDNAPRCSKWKSLKAIRSTCSKTFVQGATSTFGKFSELQSPSYLEIEKTLLGISVLVKAELLHTEGFSLAIFQEQGSWSAQPNVKLWIVNSVRGGNRCGKLEQPGSGSRSWTAPSCNLYIWSIWKGRCCVLQEAFDRFSDVMLCNLSWSKGPVVLGWRCSIVRFAGQTRHFPQHLRSAADII